MKFFHSIRWRLQLWYGVLLALLLGGFGFTAYHLESSRQKRQIDEELQQLLPILVDSQRPVPGDRERRQFRLSAKNAALFDREGTASFYHVVWLKHGDPVTFSKTAPRDVPQPKPGDPPNRSRGDLRESFLFPGPGDCVLVGRSVTGSLVELRRLAWWLTGVGGTVLVIGLAVGAWLVKRALRPVREIGIAADEIARGDLSKRIRTRETDSELGQLAKVLNSTFARLEESFARQSRFTADAAHELRTPLAVMLTHTQNALSGDDLNFDQREAFEACQRAAQRMRGLTASLLTLARIDGGGRSENETCDARGVVREAIETLTPLSMEHDIHIDADLTEVRCDGSAEQFSQVVTNLISNAIFHSQPGDMVWVKLTMDHDHAILVVRDAGQGISAEHLPHIFERFYRADQARSGKHYRTGLGLAITRAVLDSIGGVIGVESEPDVGSVFTVHIPRSREKI